MIEILHGMSSKSTALQQEWVHCQEENLGFNNANKQPRVQQPMPSVSSDAIAAQVERKVLAHIQATKPDQDAEMQDAAQLWELKGRMSKLEAVVEQHHKQQQTHNVTVAGQIGQIQQQVEHQANQLQSHFDHKLQEQLQHIEALLTRTTKE